MNVALITVVHGRHGHLRTQLAGLAYSARQPDLHVVVAVDDSEAGRIAAEVRPDAVVVPVAAEGPSLPVAAARNAGAGSAIDAGADLLVFLDVDCIPGRDMIGRYEEIAGDPRHRHALLSGPVTYLAPPPADGYDLADLDQRVDPHPARPAPASGDVAEGVEYELFWSLSFAVDVSTWQRLGGFCTDYVGYGGEDTDFGQLAAASGIMMRWVGGAHAFHQHHSVSDPPVEHLDDIVRNAKVFHDRWGWWPMSGWLDAFAEAGLIEWNGVETR